ncbi:MAG: class I SAM-dependent methyltransferase [Coprothermobacterota bacterium]|nr:class I SAM-dependent methyltransferase [Coprothermobacterota bacterium]
MKSRGQESFVSLPGFAARLYNNLTQTRAIERQHQEIARDLVSRIEHGRLLDIGTGPGKLLFEVHQLNSSIELFGLDISEAMVQLARKNLTGINVNIQCGDVRHTNYVDDFFDIVTCTGSFYLWDNPEKCLEEVFRIMKKDRSAYLYETYQDFNDSQVREALKTNLAGESLVRRLVTPIFLMRQLRMTYRTSEIVDIIKRTSFAGSYTIGQISLGGFPAWLRIQLTKCA